METTTLNRSEVIQYRNWTITTETNPNAISRGILFNYYKGDYDGQRLRSAGSLEDAKGEIDELCGSGFDDPEEMIALFMGGKKQIIGEERTYGYDPGTVLWWGLFEDESALPTRYTNYESPDWLMPVVEKINNTPGYDSIHIEKREVWVHVSGLDLPIQFHERDYPSLISRIYAAVVEYCKIKSV